MEDQAEMLYTKIRDHPLLAHIGRKYREASHNTPGRGRNTHDYMVDSIKNTVKDAQMDENKKKQLEMTTKRAQGATVSAFPAVEDDTRNRNANATSDAAVIQAASVAAAQAVSGAILPVLQGLVPGQAAAPPPPQAFSSPIDSSQWVNALASTIEAYPGDGTEKLKKIEYKPLPNGIKGGRICMEMLCHRECSLGDKCPNHHTKGYVCLAHNTLEGCNIPNCNFTHENHRTHSIQGIG